MQKPSAYRRLSIISHDLKRIVRAVPGICDYIRKPDRVDCSLSLFAAASFDVTRSLLAEYSLDLANGTSQPLSCKILIEIYKCDRPVHPEGHYARFEKSLHLLPGKSCKIRLTYDWLKLAWFILDGVALPPDDLWRGYCNAPGRYAVQAVLFDGSGNQFENLCVIQELKP
jgi:hypothetical protein